MNNLPPEIDATIEAIASVRNPRFIATERGYHGALYCALRYALDRRSLLVGDCILEMEYQKSARHGLSQRPDIILHVPAELSGGSVRDNNRAVWALKRDASASDAHEDFDKLDEMCQVLRYSMAIFVNVASTRTHLDSYRGQFPERLHAFAITHQREFEMRHSFFADGKILDQLLVSKTI